MRFSQLLLPLVAFGCAELPSEPQIPLPSGAAELNRTVVIGGREYLLFRTVEEARAQVGYAEILDAIPAVWWSGNTAVGKSSMTYFGTDGEQKLRLSAANTTYSSEGEGTTTDTHVIPYRYYFSTPDLRVPLLGSESCGGLATLRGYYLAKVTIAIEIPYIMPNGLSYDTDFRNVESRQVPCQPQQCPPGTSPGSDPNQCYADRDEPTDGGGGGNTGCVDCVTEPVITYCRVRYWYWKDTGEIFAWNTLFCA
jgi:hypothetical protein